MRLTIDHPNADKIIVLLDGKLIRSFTEADDDEGWVDVPDLLSMAPPPAAEEELEILVDEKETVTPWERIKTIRKYGKVEFKKLK